MTNRQHDWRWWIGFAIAAAFGFWIIIMLTAASAQEDTKNQVDDWCEQGIKIEDPGTPFVVPDPPEGTTWTLLIIKAGQANSGISNPTPGDSYTDPGGKEISHVILCYETVPDGTTTTSSTTSSTTPTVTSPTTTTTDPATTTSSSTTSTTVVGSTSTSSSSTTMPSTSSTDPETTTTETPVGGVATGGGAMANDGLTAYLWILGAVILAVIALGLLTAANYIRSQGDE